MEREAALADFEAARSEWEAAFARIPDRALQFLKEGDDYSLGGLQIHVNWVLEHYSRILSAILAFRFQRTIGPQDPAGAESSARAGAKRGLTSTERRPSLEQMERLHEQVRGVCSRLPDEDWERKCPVIYGDGEDPSPTSAEDIVGWLTDHYREHVQQSADLIEEWSSLSRS